MEIQDDAAAAGDNNKLYLEFIQNSLGFPWWSHG